MGKALRNHYLRGPGKQKGQALQPSDFILESLGPRPKQRQDNKVPSSSNERDRPQGKCGHLDDLGALCSADNPPNAGQMRPNQAGGA